MVKDINEVNSSSPGLLTDVNGVLFFSADDGSHGRELWKSDGAEGGTVLIKDILPGIGFGLSTPVFVNVAGTAFFGANDGVHGSGLWKSDGSTVGTVLMKALPNLPILLESSRGDLLRLDVAAA